MGCPTVCFGPKLWQTPHLEIPTIAVNEKHACYSDYTPVLVAYIKMLMRNTGPAQQIGREGRKRAVSLYGRDVLCEQWKNLIERNI